MNYKLGKTGVITVLSASMVLSACGGGGGPSAELPPAPTIAAQQGPSEEYRIGPLDTITVFIWRNPELGAKVQVRPDGRITTPLITDMPAAGKTTTMLAQDIKLQLSQYINDPIVSVIINDFKATNNQQVTITGAGVGKPASVPYRANMTLLDAITQVGGLAEYASGNRARLQRINRATGRPQEYRLRLGDLLKRGDISANVLLQPGDTIIVPESMF